jgi:murein DD-endopeptidase MepM/ murein hydrolase activator NlpD
MKHNKSSRQTVAIFQFLTLAFVVGSLVIFAHQSFAPDYETIADIEQLAEEWAEDSRPTKAPEIEQQPTTKLEPSPKRGAIVGQFRVSSPWGWRVHPISGELKLHRGVDLAMAEGTPYYFPGHEQGYVKCFYDLSGGGFIAQMRSPNYPGLFLELLHLQKGSCNPGLKQPGDVVGRVGSTGRSTGPHAHFQTVQVINGKRKHIPPSLTPLREIVKGNR